MFSSDDDSYGCGAGDETYYFDSDTVEDNYDSDNEYFTTEMIEAGFLAESNFDLYHSMFELRDACHFDEDNFDLDDSIFELRDAGLRDEELRDTGLLGEANYDWIAEMIDTGFVENGDSDFYDWNADLSDSGLLDEGNFDDDSMFELRDASLLDESDSDLHEFH